MKPETKRKIKKELFELLVTVISSLCGSLGMLWIMGVIHF